MEHTLFFKFIYWSERERKGGRERGICCSTYLGIRWWTLVCALTRDGTRNLGVLAQRSNELSYPARAGAYSFNSQFTGPRKEMYNVLLTLAIYFRAGDSSEKQISLESHIWLGKSTFSNMDYFWSSEFCFSSFSAMSIFTVWLITELSLSSPLLPWEFKVLVY